MCNKDLTSFLHAVPKVELHIHIEGSLEPHLLFQLAEKNKIALPKDDGAFNSEDDLLARYKHFTSLDDFLHYYYIGMSVLITAYDFEQLAWAYFQKAANDGVKHADIFFDPQAHLSRGIKYGIILEGLTKAKDRAASSLDLTINIVACFLRHLPVAESLRLFQSPEMQASFSNRQVIGIGLDSSEAGFPPQLFTEIYQQAVKKDLHRTAHAAEEGPAANINSALDDLSCERIDHGLKAFQDDAVMARLARDKVLLTLCPISNVLLRCVPRLEDIPVRKFLDAGVHFSLNSDDPAYFGAYILDVFLTVQKTFNLSISDWHTICQNSIEGSWCSADRKQVLLDDLAATVNKHRSSKVSA